jgi:hypothetical protein
MIPQGGTFVRPGVLAWDGVLSPPPVRGLSSCEAIEQAITDALRDGTRLEDFLDELARAQLWLPLPGRPGRVTDGSAIMLPTITSAGAVFVPAFTSVQRLATWADPRAMRAEPGGTPGQVRAGDPPWLQGRAAGSAVLPHIVVPASGLASRLPAGVGIAINPGSGASVRITADAVAELKMWPPPTAR